MTKIIHRFWAGREMPAQYAEYADEWSRLNPNHSVLLWDEGCLGDFPEVADVIEDLYRRDAGRKGIELYVQLADVVGYALVAQWGGAYFNTDMQPVRSLEGRLPDGPWASLENNEDGRIVNAAIGALTPGDPFWVGLLRGLPERYFSRPGAEMVEATGPAYLTDYAHANGGLHVFPLTTFNSVHWKQIPMGGDATPWLENLPEDAIAVHHWGHKKDGRSNTVETATQ